jgi:DNA modification methylase
MIIWVKDVFVLGHSDYHYQHEPIFYGWTPGAVHRGPPDRKQTSVWNFERPKRSEKHPTMKPVKLVAHALAMSSSEGDTVADPFGGSGTTLIACEQMARVCRTIEISPNYCDVIVERWEALTGGKAVRRACDVAV